MLDLESAIRRVAVTALLVTVGVATGFYAGWQQKGRQIQTQEIEALTTVRVKDANGVAESREKEIALVEAKEKIEVRYRTLTKEIVKYVPETVFVDKLPETADCPVTTLSVGAVGVLNAARENRDYQPATVGDAESKALTDVGLQELAVSDAEIAKQYNELAADHDALVDYVQSLIDKQNHQLNH